MAKIARTITYVDTQTGHTHKIDAQVEAGATRKQVAAALARLCGAPARVSGSPPSSSRERMSHDRATCGP
jgi:hypothetical protein